MPPSDPRAIAAPLETLHQSALELIERAVFEPTLSAETWEEIRRFNDTLVRYVALQPEMSIEWATNAPIPEEYLADHCFNTALMSIVYGIEAGYSDDTLLDFATVAFLHDLGMFDLPYPLLYRTGTFEASQRADMQRHPYLTARRLQHLDAIPEDVLFGIQDEHERPDGKGYPEEKTSATIHRFALALQVLDRYEAMIHPRPYRAEPFSPPAAMRELILLARADTLDRTTTQHWLTRLAYYPIGSYVRLNNGFAAKVASTHRDNPFSPIVLVFRDAKNRRRESPRVLDLAENPHLHIAEVLPFEEWTKSADHSVSEEGAVVEGEESQ